MGYDPRHIFNTALSFLLAAERCAEQRPLPNGQFQMLAVPEVVSIAFGVELFFKAIITLEGCQAGGHNLFTLFGLLSNKSQSAIKGAIALDDEVFIRKLEGVSKAFEHWRYIYEKPSGSADIHFLQTVAVAAKQLCESAMANNSLNQDARQQPRAS